MEQNNTTHQHETLAQLMREASRASTDLLRNEIVLVREEAKEVGARLLKDGAMAGLYGFLLALSTIPLMAFLVIGLGRILNGNFWLSSLIIAALLATPSAFLALRTIGRMKAHGFEMKRTKEILEREARLVGEKISEIKTAATRRAG